MSLGIEGKSFDSFHGATLAYLEEISGDRREPSMVLMALGAIQALVTEEKISIDGVTSKDRRIFVQNRESVFQFVRYNPDAWLVDSNTIHMAGGILPTVFGKKNEPLWEDIVRNAHDGWLSFAGIKLSLGHMQLVGDFARFLLSASGRNSKRGECVDERLDMQGHYAQVHCHCGACEALGKRIGNLNLEDDLHQRLDPRHPKRPILAGMKYHEATAIYTDLQEHTQIIRPDLRAILQRHFSLPFHASIPVKKIEEFSRKRKLTSEQEEELVWAWCQLNVQIPRNIIEGNHNELGDLHEETAHIVNVNRVKDTQLASLVYENILAVPHATILNLGRVA